MVSDLGVGDKQRVEILKVLYRGAHILILDEPTAVLVPQEVDELFRSLRELTTTGTTVIFISHKLDEVLKHADAITVIRQGKTVGEIDDPSTVTSRDLAEMMVGSELPTPETRAKSVTDIPVLDVDDLVVHDDEQSERLLVDHVSFTVHRGEIVGIAGVEGNGQSELVRALIGLENSTGAITLNGDDVTRLSTQERRAAGIGYIAEDRQNDGLVLAVQPLGERRARAPTRQTVRQGPLDRPGGRAAPDRADHRQLRRPHAGSPRCRSSHCREATSRS